MSKRKCKEERVAKKIQNIRGCLDELREAETVLGQIKIAVKDKHDIRLGSAHKGFTFSAESSGASKLVYVILTNTLGKITVPVLETYCKGLQEEIVT